MFKSTLRAFALILCVAPFAIQASAAAPASATAILAASASTATATQSNAPTSALFKDKMEKETSELDKVKTEFASSIFSMFPVGDKSLLDVLLTDNIEAFKAWPARENAISEADHNKKTILDWARAFNAAKIVAYVESLVAEDILNHSASESETTKILNQNASDSDLARRPDNADQYSDSDNDDSAAQSDSALAQRTRDLLAAQKAASKK